MKKYTITLAVCSLSTAVCTVLEVYQGSYLLATWFTLVTLITAAGTYVSSKNER